MDAALTDWQLWKADWSKGIEGAAFADFGNSAAITAPSMTVQPDGKALAATTLTASNGVRAIGLARFNPDGSPDKSFGNLGRVALTFGGKDDTWSALGVQPDGRIVVAGQSNFDFALARFLPDGTLDTAFGTAGRVTTDLGGFDHIKDIAIGADGSVTAAGTTEDYFNSDAAIVRYDVNGTLNPTFGGDGIVVSGLGSPPSDVAIQKDGKVVVAFRGMVARYRNDGELDAGSFGQSGWLSISAKRIALQADEQGGEKLILTDGYRLFRLNPNGTLDLNFGNAGSAAPNIGPTELQTGANSLSVSSTGIIAVASSNRISVFNANGESLGYGAEHFFGSDGYTAVGFSPDQRILVASTQSSGSLFIGHFVGLYQGTTSPGPIVSPDATMTNLSPNTLTITAMASLQIPGQPSPTLYTAYSSANGRAYMSDGKRFWEIYAPSPGSKMSVSAITNHYRLTYLVKYASAFAEIVDHDSGRRLPSSNELGGVAHSITWADLGGTGKPLLYYATSYYDISTAITKTDLAYSTTTIYTSQKPGEWSVTALTAGDVDGDGRDELYTAFRRSDGSAYLYRSKSSNNIGSYVYSSGPLTNRTITAMTTGDTNGDGRDELFAAMSSPDGTSSVYRSSTGTNLGSLYRGPITTNSRGVWAMAVHGDARGELVMAYQRRLKTAFVSPSQSLFSSTTMAGVTLN